MIDDLLRAFRARAPIDVSATIGAWPARFQARAQLEDLQTLTGVGVSVALVGHLGSLFAFETRSANDELFRVLDRAPRFVPMPTINPLSPVWERELEWAAAQPIGGVRVFPGYHGYDLEHPAAIDFFKSAADRHLPVHVSVRVIDDRLQHPQLLCQPPTSTGLARLIERSTGPLIVSGVSAAELRSTRNQVLPADTENVLFDVWHINGPLGIFEALENEGFIPNLCFGSAFPIQSAMASAVKISASRLSSTSLDSVLFENAKRLGLAIGERNNPSEIRGRK